MNFLFGNFCSQASQASQNQETPFFQHPNTRVSLFDNPPPSQSAFNLFNNEVDREKSIITQLEIFEREDEEKNEVMRKSRLGDTINKEREPRRELFQSRAKDEGGKRPIAEAFAKRSVSKDRLNFRLKESTNFSFMAGPSSKFTEPESFNMPLRSSQSNFDVHSNFQHYRRDEQKLEEKREQVRQPKQVTKQIKQAKEAKQLREAREQKQLKEAKEAKEVKQAKQAKEARQMKEQRQMKEKQVKNMKMEIRQEKKVEVEKPQKVEQANPASKKTAFGFNLKRSKAEQPGKADVKPEATSRLTFGFALKKSRVLDQPKFDQPLSKTIQDNPSKIGIQPFSINARPQQQQGKTPLESRFQSFDKKFFDVKIKERDNGLVPQNANMLVSRVKEISAQEEQKMMRQPLQRRMEVKDDNIKEVKQAKQTKQPKETKEMKEARENKEAKQAKQAKQAKESKQAKQIEKEKQQPLGLKEKLKSFASKPTEKLQIKSIANRGFQFKTRLTLPKQQPKPQDLSDVPTPTKCEQPQSASLPPLSISLTPPNRTGKDSKQSNDIIPMSKPTRQSQFSKYMLQVMQLMQQEETLKARCNAVKSTYRQIAMIANNINSKIAKVTR